MNGHFLLGDIHPLKYFFTFAICLGLVFFFIAPSENIHWFMALIQWQLQAVIPVSILITTHLVLSRWVWFQYLGHWYRLIISGVTGSLMSAPFALLIEVNIANEDWPDNLLIGLFEEWGGMGVPVVLSWLLMNAPILMGYEYRRQYINKGDPEKSVSAIDKPTCPFLEMANLDDYHAILALSSELHYLDIILHNDHQLVLYSLSNAIAELPSELGIQVHRSHWVAFSAVESFKKSGRQGTILLKNGKEIPVSRAKMPKVTSALAKYLN